jgi:hypothetical protein
MKIQTRQDKNNGKKELISQILIRLGHMTAEQIDQVLGKMEKSNISELKWTKYNKLNSPF